MNDPFNLGKISRVSNNPFGTFGNSMKDRVTKFILKNPIWLMYVRTDSRYPDPDGYSSEAKSPYSDEEGSFSTGFSVQFERHATRRVIHATEVDSPIEDYGYLGKYQVIIYTPRYYYPKQNDLYIEVEWDVDIDNIENYGKPLHIINAYRVSEVIAMKQHEVTYFGCGCEIHNFNKKNLEEWVKRLGNVWTGKLQV